jgi:hypothetical protein
MPATHATGERATPQDRAIFLGRRWPASACEALRLALVPLCVVVAVAVRRRVAADDLSDAADLALSAGALLFVLAALGISFRLAQPGRGLARQAVPIALVLVAGMFVARSFADVSIEMHSLGTARDSVAAVIVPGPDGSDVRYSGEIHEGDAARLARLLDAYPQATRIHLTSEGGLADEGQAFGAVIASHHLTTYVPDFCVSACTLAFLAGKERLALRDARLGFHGPFEEGLFGQTFAGDAGSVRAAYRAAGLDESFIDEALAAAPDDMWFPDPERLAESGVVTAFVDRDRLPDSNLDGAATLAGARAAVLRSSTALPAGTSRPIGTTGPRSASSAVSTPCPTAPWRLPRPAPTTGRSSISRGFFLRRWSLPTRRPAWRSAPTAISSPPSSRTATRMVPSRRSRHCSAPR